MRTYKVIKKIVSIVGRGYIKADVQDQVQFQLTENQIPFPEKENTIRLMQSYEFPAQARLSEIMIETTGGGSIADAFGVELRMPEHPNEGLRVISFASDGTLDIQERKVFTLANNQGQLSNDFLQGYDPYEKELWFFHEAPVPVVVEFGAVVTVILTFDVPTA